MRRWHPPPPHPLPLYVRGLKCFRKVQIIKLVYYRLLTIINILGLPVPTEPGHSKAYNPRIGHHLGFY